MNPTGASTESLTANPELENSLDPNPSFRQARLTHAIDDALQLVRVGVGSRSDLLLYRNVKVREIRQELFGLILRLTKIE